MTGREFLGKITHEKDDFLESFLQTLKTAKVRYCVIGGLAVNAYAEPVVSLDLDIVIAMERLEDILPMLKNHGRLEGFANSVNLSAKKSDLRIQIQTDPRYQAFISRAVPQKVLGYSLPVARIEDVLQGKIWAAMDKTRRTSKRQKDLADITRLVESHPHLKKCLSPAVKKLITLP